MFDDETKGPTMNRFLIGLLTVLVFSGVSHADEFVEGNIPFGSVWYKDLSPYRVTGDITVAGLTIEPGVDVLFEGNHNFLVVGQLVAAGTAADTVTFASSEINTTGWGGIAFSQADYASDLMFCEISGAVNSGIRVNDCSPVISNCLIRNNTGSTGGGIMVTLDAASYSGEVTITDCIIRNNRATGHGGGLRANLQTGSLTLSGCELTDNVSNHTGRVGSFVGGGIYLSTNTGTYFGMSQSTINGNITHTRGNVYDGNPVGRGGGIYLDGSGQTDIETCVIESNIVNSHDSWSFDVAYARGGGIYQQSGTLNINNSLIRDNSYSAEARDGMGMWVNGGTTQIVNSSFLRNNQNGLSRSGGTVDIRNSLFWDNAGAEIVGTVTINFSDVQDVNMPGEGNLSCQPILDGNDAIQHPSCCINAGDPDPQYNDQCFPPSVGPLSGQDIEEYYRNDIGAHGGPDASIPGGLGCPISPVSRS